MSKPKPKRRGRPHRLRDLILTLDQYRNPTHRKDR